MSIRALIVDDEPLARIRLRELLKKEPDVDVIGECACGQEAVAGIRELGPDLVFLDVQMPDFDGFEVIREAGIEKMPVIIFVTAYDDYALQAFGVHAADYLLKPFDRARFQDALEHAREHLRNPAADSGGEPLAVPGVAGPAGAGTHLDRFAVRSNGRVILLRAEEIDWMESAGNYVSLHAGKKSHLIRETLSGLESRLDPRRFIRIHRCAIVNIDRVKELETYFHGEYKVILQDGTQLTLSRNYRENLGVLTGAAL
jgi:two-component system LytT family response regulator